MIDKLASFPHHESTEALVRYAVLSPWPTLRTQAASRLRQRPLHDYVPSLLDGLHWPVKSQFLISRDRAGNVRYQHHILQEGSDASCVLARDHVARSRPGNRTEYRLNGIGLRRSGLAPGTPLVTHQSPGEEMEALRSLFTAARRERAVAQNNAGVMQGNAPIFSVLEATPGAALRRDPAQWHVWWQDYNEIQTNKQTFFQYVPTRSAFATAYQVQVVSGTSCFGAGTRVRTETGLAPIEEIEVGDRVLSQDPETGELAYKAVIETTASPPLCELLNVIVDGESVHMTAGHVAWLVAEGRRMAKRLSVGDRVQTLHGGRTVGAISVLPPAERVYKTSAQLSVSEI